MIPDTRVDADPGDRLTGRYDPPRLCRVLTGYLTGAGPGVQAGDSPRPEVHGGETSP